MEPVPGIVESKFRTQMSAAGASRSQADAQSFSSMLKEEAASLEQIERNVPPEVISFNVRNLFGGQYPPPDSGAGFFHITLALMDENNL
ncbi:MAG: hypothetical protein V3V62_08535 [bacterium]